MRFLQLLDEGDENFIPLNIFGPLLLDSNAIEMVNILESFSKFDDVLLLLAQILQPIRI